MKKRKLNFLLYGQGSCLNKGCEAIVNTTVKKIKKACDGEIILSTNDLNDKELYEKYLSKAVKGHYKKEELTPEEQEKIEYYNSIPFNYENYERLYTKDCIKEISNADICFSIGGDNYCYGKPYWFYTLDKEIVKQGKKNVFWCCSLFEKIDSPEMIRDLRLFDLIITRETLSYKALLEVVDEERVLLLPDTAFSLEPKKIELPKYFKGGKKVVGINVSPLVVKENEEGKRLLESVKALVKHILEKSDYEICLVPHVYVDNNNDLDTLKKVKEVFDGEERLHVLDEGIYDCEELKYIISNLHILIAARTHASIAGYSSAVPTLVIGYSVKSKGIAKDLFGEHENYVLPYEKITPQNIINQYEFIEDNYDSIKDTLKGKMPEIKRKADNLIETMLEKLDELDKKYVTNKSLCTGCMACKNICPAGAIEEYEYEGFKYTRINEKKCTKCNLCKKVCPVNKVYENKKEDYKVYGAKNVDEDIRKQSSSGGIVSALAENIIDNEGIVYGTEFSNMKNSLVRIDKKDDVKRIRGSKYIPSDVGDIYKKVKEDLENKKEVLFTGVPCQVEGLKTFLNKEYDNLYCASVICHGMPSMKMFKKHIKEKEDNTGKKIVNVNFRNKETGWHDYSIKYEYEDGTIENVKSRDDYFMKGFLKDYYLRESCYNCNFKMENKNAADLVLGDFWGIEKVNKEADDNKGTSVIIINSDKGNELIERLNKDNIELFDANYDDIVKYNPSSKYPANYKGPRSFIFEKADKNEIDVLVDYYINVEQNQNNDIMLREEAEKEINKRDEEIKKLAIENKKIFDELQGIYNSKRWKFIDKIGNFINRVFRRK